ncbi:MAG: carbohydrate ABC transporter permease, partial [Alphaproteobacteria bacterium]
MKGKVRRRTIFAFLGPAIVALAVIGIAPLLFAAYTSLHNYNLTKLRKVKFIGLDNFTFVLTDPVFWDAMQRTVSLLVIVLPLQLLIGLGIALLLHQPGIGLLKTLTRLSLVVPMATTYSVVGLLGQVMFNIKYGVVNQLIGFIGIEPVNWIGDPENAFVAVAFWDVWQW